MDAPTNIQDQTEFVINDQEIYYSHIAMKAVLMMIKDGYVARGIKLLHEEELWNNKSAQKKLRSINKKFEKKLKSYNLI